MNIYRGENSNLLPKLLCIQVSHPLFVSIHDILVAQKLIYDHYSIYTNNQSWGVGGEIDFHANYDADVHVVL